MKGACFSASLVLMLMLMIFTYIYFRKFLELQQQQQEQQPRAKATAHQSKMQQDDVSACCVHLYIDMSCFIQIAVFNSNLNLVVV